MKSYKKAIKQEITKCYGAYDSLQTQIHHVVGLVNEIRVLLESLTSCFNDLTKVISEVVKK